MNIGRIATVSAVLSAALLATTFSAFGQCDPDKRLACAPPVSDPTPQVCFYTQPDFGGRFFCETGQRRVNEVDVKWRDQIKSVQVINNASVLICEEFNRDGECQLISKDDPELSPKLFDHLYSYKIRK